MADWDTRLTFVITPKSGPLRKMVGLRDAQQALIADLPPGFLRRAHWLKAGKALVTAAETVKPKDIATVSLGSLIQRPRISRQHYPKAARRVAVAAHPPQQ